MPGAAQEREASADSRAKAFKNKGKDNEVSISPTGVVHVGNDVPPD